MTKKRDLAGTSTIAASLCCGGSTESDGMSFVQFMNCVLALDAMDDALGCACLRRATTKDGKDENDGDGLEGNTNRTVAGGMVYSDSSGEYSENWVCCLGKYFCASVYCRAAVWPSPVLH